MKRNLRPLIVVALSAAASLIAFAALESGSPVAITSITTDGAQLVVTADAPPGLQLLRLETRDAMDAPWTERHAVGVQPGGGPATLSLPKPDAAHVFLRLVAVPLAQGAQSSKQTTQARTLSAAVPAELDYVTIPPIGSGGQTDAVLHVKGTIDGSDRIYLTRSGALWSHVNWEWPHGTVTVNSVGWKPGEKNFVTTRGQEPLLAANLAFDNATLEIIKGRDVIALERAADALVVFVNDTPLGAGEYEFKLRFHPHKPEAAEKTKGTPAKLKIAATIDGSDSIRISADEARWTHKAFAPPASVRFNTNTWSNTSNVLKNAGATAYLPHDVDFSTARITARKGRDLATLRAEKDHVLVHLADNPNGSDAYEIEIAFGP